MFIKSPTRAVMRPTQPKLASRANDADELRGDNNSDRGVSLAKRKAQGFAISEDSRARDREMKTWIESMPTEAVFVAKVLSDDRHNFAWESEPHPTLKGFGGKPMMTVKTGVFPDWHKVGDSVVGWQWGHIEDGLFVVDGKVGLAKDSGKRPISDIVGALVPD